MRNRIRRPQAVIDRCEEFLSIARYFAFGGLGFFAVFLGFFTSFFTSLFPIFNLPSLKFSDS